MQFFTRIAALAVAAAPFLNAAPVESQPPKELIPGKYIVQLKPDADVASIAAHHNKVRSIYTRNLARRGEDGTSGSPIEREFGFGEFKAYAGSFDEATIEELKAMPEVLQVEQDFMMRADAIVTQESAPWGLGSISSRIPGVTSYVYDDSAGDGTFTYIIDSGVRVSHNEFEGRATWGINTASGGQADENGHGTHVAGSAGGKTYGVAKKTNIIAVKVLSGSAGSASAVFSGFDWTVNDIVSKGRQNTAVINMSLGATASTTWDAAVTAAWNKGVLIVTSSGNAESPASGYSPCRSPEVICVGNIEITNKRHGGPGGSNYGPEVDIFAAGTNVTSASYLSDTGSAPQTGTSMASPHVAGLISYIRALEGPMSAAAVKARLFELSTLNVVTDPKGSVNRLAYNGNNRR